MGPSPGIGMDGEDPSGGVREAVDHRRSLISPFAIVPSLFYKVEQGIGGDHRGDIPLDKDAHLARVTETVTEKGDVLPGQLRGERDTGTIMGKRSDGARIEYVQVRTAAHLDPGSNRPDGIGIHGTLCHHLFQTGISEAWQQDERGSCKLRGWDARPLPGNAYVEFPAAGNGLPEETCHVPGIRLKIHPLTAGLAGGLHGIDIGADDCQLWVP